MSVADPALQAASSTGPSRGAKALQLSNSGFLGARRPQKQEAAKPKTETACRDSVEVESRCEQEAKQTSHRRDTKEPCTRFLRWMDRKSVPGIQNLNSTNPHLLEPRRPQPKLEVTRPEPKHAQASKGPFSKACQDFGGFLDP